jgi:hypothetical protein
MVVLLTAVLVLAMVGVSLAQERIPDTEPGGPEVPAETLGSTGEPDGAVSQEVQAQEGPAATDGGTATLSESQPSTGLAPDDNPATGAQPAAPQVPQQTFSYYLVAGATLRGRTSATQYAYDSQGCVHVTAGVGTARILNTELHIPDGSVIKYLRLYYDDTSTTGNISGYLTRYTPGTATNDLVNVSSSVAGAGGNGFVVSSEITETVDNDRFAYTLIGWPSATTSQVQVCGLRIAYYAPVGRLAFLPVIRKNATTQ